MGLAFVKRPSGGRGEYELTGEDGEVSASDLDGFGFILETPLGEKNTELMLSHQGGKPRLRTTLNQGLLIQRQLAALVMLPRSTRSEAAVSDALPVILANRYVLDIDIDLVSTEDGIARVRPTSFNARSAGLTHLDERHRSALDAGERFAQLRALYQKEGRLSEDLSNLVKRHADATGSISIGVETEQIVKLIMKQLEKEVEAQYLPGADPLPTLLGLVGEIEMPPMPEPPDTPQGAPEIRRRTETYWRSVRDRGASGSKFRKAVQAAYDFRCVFCGLRAPSPAAGRSPGVDAAHILPWGNYDLDVVSNGLILCKQHHWAFDAHILILEHDSGDYHVRLELVDSAPLAADPQTVDELRRAEGEIPTHRLPRLQSHRPDPGFIEELYRV